MPTVKLPCRLKRSCPSCEVLSDSYAMAAARYTVQNVSMARIADVSDCLQRAEKVQVKPKAPQFLPKVVLRKMRTQLGKSAKITEHGQTVDENHWPAVCFAPHNGVFHAQQIDTAAGMGIWRTRQPWARYCRLHVWVQLVCLHSREGRHSQVHTQQLSAGGSQQYHANATASIAIGEEQGSGMYICAHTQPRTQAHRRTQPHTRKRTHAFATVP